MLMMHAVWRGGVVVWSCGGVLPFCLLAKSLVGMRRRDPEERWHIQQVMECSMFKTGDELIEQLQVCPVASCTADVADVPLKFESAIRTLMFVPCILVHALSFRHQHCSCMGYVLLFAPLDFTAMFAERHMKHHHHTGLDEVIAVLGDV